MNRYQRLRHREAFGTAEKPYRKLFRSEVLSGKDEAGHYLPGHDHAYFLPTAAPEDPRRITHLTVCAHRGFDAAETAALTELRQWRVGELAVRSQLIGLGTAGDFRTPLFGGPNGAAHVWESITPYLGPAHVGRTGRERSLRKALRRELRRWLARRHPGVEILAVEVVAEAERAAERVRPIEFRRGRCRPGDDGFRRPFALFRLTLGASVEGPLCLGYASHYGLGLFLPAPAR
jgi:CRISPR-associated protein Csb2